MLMASKTMFFFFVGVGGEWGWGVGVSWGGVEGWEGGVKVLEKGSASKVLAV